MNTICIELCAEDRARLDKLQTALDHVGEALFASKMAEIHQIVKNLPEADTAPEQEPVQTPKEETIQPSVGNGPEVTVDDLRSKVVQLVSAGKKEATRSIIKEYGNSVGEIPADKCAEVMKRLEELEG